MSERYSRVFLLPEKTYAAECPVMIENGALLKDNKTGKILAQLQLINIAEKKIKAVEVKLDCFDTARESLGEPVVFEYLDLDAGRDVPFGAKTPIPIPNTTAREFDAKVVRIVFEDLDSISLESTEWKPLPGQKPLEDVLGKELSAQYKREVSSSAVYEPIAFDGLWKCTCGAINQTDEHKCHKCKLEKDKQFLALDRETLLSHKTALEEAEARKKAEAKARAEAAQEEKARREELAKAEAERIKKHKKKVAGISTLIVCTVVAAVVILVNVIIPSINYNQAIEQMEKGEYAEAILLFQKLGDYKDSPAKILESEEAIRNREYNRAVELMNAGNYEQAEEIFRALEGYRDSKQMEKRMKISIRLANAKEALKTIKVGDHINLGAYNGEDIVWRVLEVRDESALVISEYGLFESYYYASSESHKAWESSTLRKKLNGSFYSEAFSAEEADLILTTTVEPHQGGNKTISQGSPTEDKLFLLSYSEVLEYFGSKSSRLCKDIDRKKTCYWWLRTVSLTNNLITKGSQYSAATVVDDGSIEETVFWQDHPFVRPAMWIDLSQIK